MRKIITTTTEQVREEMKVRNKRNVSPTKVVSRIKKKKSSNLVCLCALLIVIISFLRDDEQLNMCMCVSCAMSILMNNKRKSFLLR